MSDAPTPQLEPTANGFVGQGLGDFVDIARVHAHHGFAGGIERGGENERHVFGNRRFGGRLHFFRRGHGFDPDDINAARNQAR